MKDRNMNIRNFGLGSRDMGRALTTAYKLAGNGFNSNAQAARHCKNFGQYLKAMHNIKDLKKVSREHVQAYAEFLRNRYEDGEVGADRIRNMLSTVNVALKEARRDSTCRVRPVEDAGFPKKSGIATKDHSIDDEKHSLAKESVDCRLSALLELQRAFGLRFKESALLDAKSALQKALSTSSVEVEYGTKGGRPRVVPVISEHQIQALQVAANIQGDAHSMIPTNMNWSEYQSYCYRQMPHGFHGERHHYANERYEQLTGVPSPVRANILRSDRFSYIANKLGLSLHEARKLDHQARRTVSEELGHSRISITNAYLG